MYVFILEEGMQWGREREDDLLYQNAFHQPFPHDFTLLLSLRSSNYYTCNILVEESSAY